MGALPPLYLRPWLWNVHVQHLQLSTTSKARLLAWISRCGSLLAIDMSPYVIIATVHSGLGWMTFYDGRGTHHMRNPSRLSRAFRTASDKSWGGGLGTRLQFHRSIVYLSLAWPRPFPRRLVGGAGGGEEGRRVWWLWTGCCWLCRNAGRTNQIEAACNLWHDFRFERVTRFYIFDMAEIEKIQDCLLSSFTARLHAVDVQTKRR